MVDDSGNPAGGPAGPAEPNTALTRPHTRTLRDGATVLIRRIGPADEPALARFHAGLSEQTVRQRYFLAVKLDQRVEHARLARICASDPAHDLVLVALAADDVVGVGRVSRAVENGNRAEFALLLADAWQGRGLGTLLMGELLSAARAGGVRFMSGETLAHNVGMTRIAERYGFSVNGPNREGVVHFWQDLGPADAAQPPSGLPPADQREAGGPVSS